MTDKLKTVVIVTGFLGFLIGLILGSFLAYRILNARLYNEMRSDDLEIWIRIGKMEGEKEDLESRIARLSKYRDEYNLAIAQIKVYEMRKEIMNIRLSDDD